MNKMLCLLFAFALGYLEDQCDDAHGILNRHNYSYEFHKVETEDGFILGVFRITGRAGSDIDESKTAVVMQHGINASPNSFMSNGESSIAFYLVNRGFEVWLPSSRGTSYSSEHKTLSPDDSRYWDFSFEDLGTKDTKAYLEYIYKKKGEKVLYLGYSQGFMQIMAAYPLDPEFFEARLKKIVGWGPAARLDLSTNIWLSLLTYARLWPLVGLNNILGIKNTGVFNRKTCLSKVRRCERNKALCRLVPMFNGEFLPYNNNPYYASGSDASSIKCLQHIVFNIGEGGFFKFDAKKELEEYDLTKINIPLGIMAGEADLLAPPANAKWIAHVFRNNKNFKMIGTYNYLGHVTFTASYTQFQHYTDTYNFLIE